jgi:transcriptional regulator with XRE-family HTH domain
MEMREIEHHFLLEEMRATLRYAVFTCGNSCSDIAASVGVAPSTLTRLLNGGDLKFSSWGRILRWCESYGVEPPHPEQAALSLLVSQLPVAERQLVREAIVRWMKHKILSCGDRIPPWLEDELLAWQMMRQRSRRTSRCPTELSLVQPPGISLINPLQDISP